MTLNALADFACNEELAGYHSGKIQVTDSALAEQLEQLADAWEDMEGALEWLDERVDKL